MGFWEKLKEFNRQVSYSILGNYSIEFEKLRMFRIFVFFVTIFLLNIDVYLLFPSMVRFINLHVHYLVFLMFFLFILLIIIPKYYEKKIDNLKKQKANSSNVNVLWSIIAKVIYRISLVSIVLVTLFFSLISMIILQFFDSSLKSSFEVYLNNPILKYVLALITVVIIYLISRELFNKESEERGFVTKKLSIGKLKQMFYKEAYIVSMVLSTVIEFGLVYPTWFLDKETHPTGCVKGRTSLIKARRYLNAKGFNFEVLPIYVNNPRYISLFNASKEITFHVCSKTKTNLINFGDYCLITHESNKEYVEDVEYILKRNGLISTKYLNMN